MSPLVSDGDATSRIVVIGGGPGGSTIATLLARQGHEVVLFEKAHHPRFHLGESLLPQTMPIVEELGLLPTLAERFQHKHGACFHSRSGEERAQFDFSESFTPGKDLAFQVVREELDLLLLENARKAGASAREGWEVKRVIFEPRGGARVEATSETGEEIAVLASFVVDASGRDALLARRSRATSTVSGLDQTALFSHFDGVARPPGRRAGDIQIPIFEGGWFWVIPFKDGRTSVGAVCKREWVQAQRERGAKDKEALFEAAIRETPYVARTLEGATRQWPIEATADFSYRVEEIHGDGWLAVGDAAGFIDPLFSTGVHLALHGASTAAPVIDKAIRSGDVGGHQFDAWARTHRAGAELFIGVVQAFYAGELEPYLFAQKKHPFLTKAITSLLSGDVFGESDRWAGELRRRFPPR